MHEVEIFNSAVKSQFAFLKQDKSILDSMIKSIPIENFGFLAPINYAHAENKKFLDLLTQSKNIFLNNSSKNAIQNSELIKENLVSSILKSDGSILFAIYENNGNIVGFIGFGDCINEFQNFKINYFAKAQDNIAQDIICPAIHSLLEWARTTFNVETFNLSVTDEDENALKFFKESGFRVVKEKAIENEAKCDAFTNRVMDSTNNSYLELIYENTKETGESLILTAGPSISQREVFYAYDAAKNGWNSQWNKYLTKFENTFAEFVGAKYAISTSSCTGALQIALMALDIGPGDEVIVPDETWVASANAIRYVGAIPIFADVEIDSWNIDATSIERVITDRTKAIIVVHMYGGPARMDKIMQIAKQYNLKVVEDAAPAIGAKFNGKSCGTFGSFGAYSFQGAKLLVTGEGGMLVTDDENLYHKAHKIADQGRDPKKVFWIDEKGIKFKMSNVQAALGLGQIERANELIAMKRRIFSWYERELANYEGITLNKEIENGFSIYWMSSIRLDEDLPITRDELIKELKLRNVDSRPVFPAISRYPIWSKKQEPQKIADLLGRTAMNLPSGVCLTEQEVVYISNQIKLILGKK